MMMASSPTLLAQKHAHPRDSRIQFEEASHVYTIDDGSHEYISVTTHIHGEHFEHFDADRIITKMMNSARWSTSKYYGMSREAIKEQWNENGRVSSELGTKLHNCIEDFYNGVRIDDDRLDGIETEYKGHFLSFHEEYAMANDYEPYRTEWCVFDVEHRLAGSIDMVYRRRRVGCDGDQGDGEELMIFDWKRTKALRRDGYGTGRGCLSELPDANFWHYAMQLNVYRWMLQRNYGKRVVRLALVVLHPNQETYKVVEVPLLDELVEAVMRQRRVSLGLEKASHDGGASTVDVDSDHEDRMDISVGTACDRQKDPSDTNDDDGALMGKPIIAWR